MRNLILSLVVLFTISNVSYAQTVSPDSLLDSSPPDMSTTTPDKEKKQVEEDPESQMPTQSWDETGWIQHNRALQCHSMANVRAYTMARGQEIILSGFKNPQYVPSDPFEGLIITHNPITGEYTLLLIQVSTGLTCIVQMGTSIQTTLDIIMNLQEQQKGKSTEK